MKTELLITVAALLTVGCIPTMTVEEPIGLHPAIVAQLSEDKGLEEEAVPVPSRQMVPVLTPPAGIEPPAAERVPPPPAVPEILWEGDWPGKGEEGSGISFNFSGLPIGDFMAQIAEVIPFNYLIAPEVETRQVTVKTTAPLGRSDLFPFMVRVLEANEVVVVKDEDLYQVLSLEKARFQDLPVVGGEIPESLPAGEGMVVYVHPLRYVLPAEILEILNPLKAPATIFLAHSPSRALVVVDFPEKIQQYLDLIQRLDVPYFQNLQVELFPLTYSDSGEMTQDLTKIFSAVFLNKGGEPAVTLIPIKRMNSVVVFSRRVGLLSQIREWISKLDQPSTGGGSRIFVYHLENAEAKALADVLSQIFKDFSLADISAASTGSMVVNTSVREPSPETPEIPGRPSPQERGPIVASLGATAKAPEIVIIPDEASNSLIIRASPQEYPIIEATLLNLDTAPKQVLIEVLIAEVTLGDENQFGLEWGIAGEGLNMAQEATAVFTEGGLSATGTGLTYLVTQTERLTGVLKAYANQSKINILSSPHIVTADNREATINVGAEIPIVTSETRNEEGTSVDKKVEYRNTGVILKVKPHISQSRAVTMEIEQEVSEAQKNLLGGTDSPIILTRKASTTMRVEDGQTLLIGGLIKEKRERSREGIPILASIPVLGYFFSYTVDKIDKTELILLLTPRVITSSQEAREVSDPFKERVRVLKRRFE